MNLSRLKRFGIGIFLASLGLAQQLYRKPAQTILDVLNAPATPVAFVSPTGTHLILLESSRNPGIAEISQPMLRLAGWRINPKTFGPHLQAQGIGMTLRGFEAGRDLALALPAGMKVTGPLWSGDGAHFAFTGTVADEIQLWVGETSTGRIHKIDGVRLNAVANPPVHWMPDSRTLLVRLVSPERGAVPTESVVPGGPNVQESSGRAGPIRTYEDMLANSHDEELFDYYFTAQLALVDSASGKISPMGKPGIYQGVQPSPDGQNLLVAKIHRPYSYLHPSFAFPKDVEIWDRAGQTVHKIASLPLADRVPINGVPVGPRSCEWRPTEPATLVWVEAMDGGNPKEKAPHRDRLLMLKAPFQAEPTEFYKTKERFRGIDFAQSGAVAIVSDYEPTRRWLTTQLVDMDHPTTESKVLFTRNVQDRYKDPGFPVELAMPNGQTVLRQSGDEILYSGLGASPEGDRPFLDRLNLKTGRSERLFRAEANAFETIVAVLDNRGERILTRRETPTDPPNYFLRNTGNPPSSVALTHYVDHAPQLHGITKQLVKYQRSDGVPLSFTLYLPPGYKPGTPLPTVLWAYPLEFNDSDTAGQITGSTQRFTSITGISELFFVLAGYALLDNAAMPVVGTPETVNNTYVDQIVMDAQAAIDKAVEMGVTDRDRVGVGGHSYGAFMTANLLAHSKLFRAGIARSGAYNRTLTPFGFQSERRILWEAPDVYLKMSPFLSADKIKAPILLIHGAADDNTGTFPIQSERMYQAIRGNGGTARLVILPAEAHAYRARESIEHTLWEMITWFDRYVKGAPSSTGAN